MPWRPPSPGECPSLGWQVLDWVGEFLAAPDCPPDDPQPLILTDEQARFVLRFYELDPHSGQRLIRRGVISRPKGWGKSPLLSAIALAEALAPVVPDGWDADGQPVGKPWSEVRTPMVWLAAVSEDQTSYAWSPLLEMAREGRLVDAYPGVEPLDTFVNLPKGKILPVTAAARSREGGKPVFALLDQTESWVPSSGGVRLAETIRRGLTKTGGSSIEAPNAYVPGEGSVAEHSAEYAVKLSEGRARQGGLLWDHREAPPETDLSDRESLRAGLLYAYGDSAKDAGGWHDVDRTIADIWDPDAHPQDSRRFFLNQVTHASDSWIAQPEWAACFDGEKFVADNDAIVLGFDGSRKRVRSTTDASALIGCRVSDGHLFTLGVWEEPDGPDAQDWQVPTFEIDRAVRGAVDRFNVVGFFADPALWESYVAAWEADFGKGLPVRASRNSPIGVNLGSYSRVAGWLEAFQQAVVAGELSHDGGSALTRHVLNARRRVRRGHVIVTKEHPESARKIDAAYAAMLAWACRLEAVSSNAGLRRKRSRRLAF